MLNDCDGSMQGEIEESESLLGVGIALLISCSGYEGEIINIVII